MKKFVWPYQRLLDIKNKQERAMRAELVLMTEEAIGIRGRIMMLKMLLRNMLSELKERSGKKQITHQAEFMRHVHVKDAEILRLQVELDQVEQKRNEKLKEIMKLQKFRKSLERLRAKALADYQMALNRHDQNELDDNIMSVRARGILLQH